MSAVLQHPGNLYELTLPDGMKIDIPNFTCLHCQRTVNQDPKLTPATEARMIAAARDRGFTDAAEVMRLWHAQFEESRVCRACNALTCCEPGCVADCRNIYEQDGPLAAADVLRQPWMLRDEQSYPVDRVRLEDGSEKLVRRRDNGLTKRELERMVRE